MERFTNSEVSEQKERFDLMMSKIDLVKAGKKITSFMRHDKKDGLYTPYVFIGKYLKFCGIERSMYHPTLNEFYGNIFERSAMGAFLTDVLNKNK